MMKIVAEMMIFANAAVGQRIHAAFPRAALLRRHPPPRREAFTEVRVCALLSASCLFSSVAAQRCVCLHGSFSACFYWLVRVAIWQPSILSMHPSVLATHTPPHPPGTKQVAALCESLGSPLELEAGPAALAASLAAAAAAAPPAVASLIKSLATRAMSEAEYFCTGGLPTPVQQRTTEKKQRNSRELCCNVALQAHSCWLLPIATLIAPLHPLLLPYMPA